MRNIKPSRRFHKSARIEIFGSLAEKFGSDYKMQTSPEKENKTNALLDHLFSTIHDN